MESTVNANKRYRNTLNNAEIPVLRNCSLCEKQPVCLAFSLFKQTIENNILSEEDTGLKAENLAKICNLYVEKGLR